MAQPGGNLTGFANFEPAIIGKWLELLKEVAPHVTRVGILRYGDGLAGFLPMLETLAPSFGIEAFDISVRSTAELERAVAVFAAQSNAGLIVLPDPHFTFQRRLIGGLAAKHRIPTVYPFSQFVVDGGLLSYGVNQLEPFRQAAFYINRR